MVAYAIRRVIAAVPTLLGILLLTFVMFRLLPTDIADEMAPDAGSTSTRDDIRWAFGLDKPLLINTDAVERDGWTGLFESQLFDHVGSLVRFDLGRSRS